MRRRRYQCRLKEKLDGDNQERTDVSRQSLPRSEDNTLVPDITFSDIMPNETIQESIVQRRRSSRLSAAFLNASSSTAGANEKLPVKRGSRSKRVSSASHLEQTAEKSATFKLSAETLSAGSAKIPTGSAVIESTAQGATQGRCSDSEECADTLPEKSSSRDTEDGIGVDGAEGTTIHDMIVDEDTATPTITQDAADEEPPEERGRTLRNGTLVRSKIPNSGARTRAAPKRYKSRRPETDGAEVNDENNPRNSVLSSQPTEESIALPQKELKQHQEQSDEMSPARQAGNDVLSAELVSGATRSAREDSVPVGEAKLMEERPHIEEREIPTFDSRRCRVVLERFDLSQFEPVDEESSHEPQATGIDDDNEVSIETLEIRKRIERKCLRDSSSSEDEEDPRPVAALSEKLFDTLIEPRGGRVSTEVLDSSSYYHGEIPSRVFLPEPKSGEQANTADSLAERFEAFKQSNSQKTLAARTIAARKAQEPSVPSFTLEEDPTTDFAEVTERAITLCNEEDSDADLDVVMASRSRRSAAVGNTMVDPAFCDIGTSMGFPSEHREQESLVLMIDSNSRESNLSRQGKPEIVIQSEDAEPWSDAGNRDGCVSDGDVGEELRNPRKSKLQSTLLPSPPLTHEMAVGTGPSLVATSRCVDSTLQAEASVAEDEVIAEECDEGEAPLQEGCGDRHSPIDAVAAFENDPEERRQGAPKRDRENSQDVPKAEASPKLLEVLSRDENLLPEEELYETDEVLSEGEADQHAHEQEEDAPERENIVPRENEEIKEARESRSPTGEGAEVRDEEIEPVVEVIDEPVNVSCEPSSVAKTSRESNSPMGGFAILDERSRTENPLAGMNDLSLIDLIDVGGDALDLPEFASPSASRLSEPPSKRSKSKTPTAKLLLPETPKSKSALRDDYRIARDTKRGGDPDTPLSLYKEIRKSRVSRRALFDESAEILMEIQPNLPPSHSIPMISIGRCRKSFALDSSRLPSFDDTYVETQFDPKELKKRGDELFQSAVRNLLDLNPESRSHLQLALENLLASHQEPIKQMMNLLVKKYALKEACEAREESYFNTQSRLTRTRKYIMDTAAKLMPEGECNIVKVFGFNPFEFKEPPPETVREMNKRRAGEDEARLKNKSKKTV